MSQENSCSSCGEKKIAQACGLCQKPICKQCLQHVDSHDFSFMSKMPKEVKQGNTCPQCYDAHVLPLKTAYDETMEKAEDVYFLTKNYPGYVRVLRRHAKRVSVESCDDRRETILRLAFFAAELGFNAIIEADLKATKIVKGKYQTSFWTGSAMPALIDGDQLERSSLRRL